jgi:hypothetical protein
MRYKAKSIAALQLARGSLPDKMPVEVEADIGVSAKRVGDLRKVTEWPTNLAIITPLVLLSQKVAAFADEESSIWQT